MYSSWIFRHHFDDLFSISKRHVAHNAKELLELLAFAGDRHEGEVINAERAVVKVDVLPFRQVVDFPARDLCQALVHWQLTKQTGEAQEKQKSKSTNLADSAHNSLLILDGVRFMHDNMQHEHVQCVPGKTHRTELVATCIVFLASVPLTHLVYKDCSTSCTCCWAARSRAMHS